LPLRDAYLFVRDIAANGGPVVPGSWTVKRETGSWYTYRANDDARLAAWRANTDVTGTRGLYLVLGARAKLDELAEAANEAEDPAAPLVAVWNARNTSALAMAVMRRWPVWRFTGLERLTDPEGATTTPAVTNGVRRIIPEGATLPNPNVTALPWNIGVDGALTTLALAKYRVTGIAGPALNATIAGFTDHEDAESTT
jgi:hypothetical protein